ncbi:MAG: magnesium chelatase [Saprospiraceae bacterium]|nr:magnesium chelatase [Saprospiraceae bacterium]
MPLISTLGQLRDSGYTPKSVKQEMRDNLIRKIQNKEKVFDGIKGFDDTVLPDIERAILSRHNILLLGLRGQAKTRIARMLTTLMDEYIPVVKGAELNDDPLHPLSRFAIDLISEKADDTPVAWMHRSERYVEKLATPDVSIADLIGDVDPIIAATLKLPYSDERVIHFGLIPRSHRSIFVINELPDLQARIQVSLFNILQEGDLQIRGFKLRLPLDISFVFTANPEDYTNRGSIITPLKDRIESQILTHYPRSLDTAMSITAQEARIHKDQKSSIEIPDIHRRLIEMISFNARESEYVDEKSGVSARLSISAIENLYSTAERRMLLNGESHTTTRITDFWGVVPAITGKVELVYEGEQEGPYNVAMNLIFKSCKELFLQHFPNPNQKIKRELKDEYGVIKMWFSGGNSIEILNDDNDKLHEKNISQVAGLKKFTESYIKHGDELLPMMELVLFGLSESEVIGKNILENSLHFSDPLSDMFNDMDN